MNTFRRSLPPRSRRTSPAFSIRSTTPVIAPVVSPVSSASLPAVTRPSMLRKSRHSRSELETPTRLATVCPKITPSADDFRTACSSSCISAARAFGLDRGGFISYSVYILATKLISSCTVRRASQAEEQAMTQRPRKALIHKAWCANVALHFEKRLAAIEDRADQPVRVHFTDGTSAEGDFVIGADGVHSVVRSHVVPDGPKPFDTGLVGFGGFVPRAVV